jgi:CRP/FNR family cyclic AMP-dependent transcriptional regulator
LFCFPVDGRLMKIESEIIGYLDYAGIQQEFVRKQHPLFREGEKNEQIIVLKQGLIKITKVDIRGNLKIVGFIKSGTFGYAGFFQGKNYPATTTTITDCLLYRVPRSKVEELIHEQPKFRSYLYTVMDRYIEYYINNSIMQTYNTLEVQLAYVLFDFTYELGKKLENGDILINMKLSDETLSSIIGTNRETVSRIMGKFREAGWIRKENRTISIVQFESFKKAFHIEI